MANPADDAPRKRHMRFMPTSATFRLGKQIGVGTVGAVFEAESDELDCHAAVKLLHPHIADDDTLADRFQREIVIMQRLQHPNIVRHFGGGLMEGRFFYAMQLLERGSLKDRLARGPLPWPVAAYYADQVASALQHAHNHGVIHRDLKPSNLFFGEDGTVLLGDFGIARDLHDEDISDDGLAVGTYAYMSPEQIVADRQITGQSDLYSLGCVIYEMLVGRPPFLGANFAQIWDQHLHAPPKSFHEQGVDCPAWLEELIFNLLAKDAADRPFNARAFQGRLREELEKHFGPDYRRLLAAQAAADHAGGGHAAGDPPLST